MTELKVSPTGVVRKVAWAAIQNRSLLFARSRGQTLFYSLGGKIDAGESSEQALVREVGEEASVEIIPESIKHAHTFIGPCHGYVEGTKLEMQYYAAEFRGKLAPNKEIEELAWFTSKDKYRTTEMGGQILDWFLANDYID